MIIHAHGNNKKTRTMRPRLLILATGKGIATHTRSQVYVLKQQLCHRCYEGVDLRIDISTTGEMDHNKIQCNDIFEIRAKYGIEAARNALRKEMVCISLMARGNNRTLHDNC